MKQIIKEKQKGEISHHGNKTRLLKNMLESVIECELKIITRSTTYNIRLASLAQSYKVIVIKIKSSYEKCTNIYQSNNNEKHVKRRKDNLVLFSLRISILI